MSSLKHMYAMSPCRNLEGGSEGDGTVTIGQVTRQLLYGYMFGKSTRSAVVDAHNAQNTDPRNQVHLTQ